LIYPASWTCAFKEHVYAGQVSLVNRPCVVKSITFTPFDTVENEAITVNILDGSTEIFALTKIGLANYSDSQFFIKFPLAGLRINDSFEIELEGASDTRRLNSVIVMYQAGSNDDIVVI